MNQHRHSVILQVRNWQEHVQRYGALTVDKEITDQEIRIHLGNFYDEAYLMVRINDGTPGQVTGGELTNVTGNLYLLHAQESEVVIERN